MLSHADLTISEPGTGYQGPVVLFKRWITLSSEYISIQWITQSVFLILSTAGQCFTHWIVLFIFNQPVQIIVTSFQWFETEAAAIFMGYNHKDSNFLALKFFFFPSRNSSLCMVCCIQSSHLWLECLQQNRILTINLSLTCSTLICHYLFVF